MSNGQLLQSSVWFHSHYQDKQGSRIVVHPNAEATGSVTVGDTLALTLPKLGELVGSVRELLDHLTWDKMDLDTLVAKCESRLRDLNLAPDLIEERYLQPFVIDN